MRIEKSGRVEENGTGVYPFEAVLAIRTNSRIAFRRPLDIPFPGQRSHIPRLPAGKNQPPYPLETNAIPRDTFAPVVAVHR